VLRDMEITRGRRAVQRAAAGGEKVRVVGTVMGTGNGFSAGYRNRWVRVEVSPGVFVRFGASTAGTLGSLPEGTAVDLVVRLTGTVDLRDSTYAGKYARLLS
jgi:hypothetical protein